MARTTDKKQALSAGYLEDTWDTSLGRPHCRQAAAGVGAGTERDAVNAYNAGVLTFDCCDKEVAR